MNSSGNMKKHLSKEIHYKKNHMEIMVLKYTMTKIKTQ